MDLKEVWKGIWIATIIWIPTYIIVGNLIIYFGWDKSIHPLINLPISAVIVLLIAIPYLTYKGKKS
jgi:Na+-transporting methylmalonyl-CoA/oxaloacetate decarboxylase beta subunit